MSRGTLKKWLIIIAVVYLLFPRDLIPDFIGRGLGFIEDLLLIAFLTYFYRKYAPRDEQAAAGAEAERKSADGSREKQKKARRSFDPYQVLGISPGASKAEIQQAYRARLAEYHPDKVNHLGEELQKLAHEKVLEITKAYEQLL